MLVLETKLLHAEQRVAPAEQADTAKEEKLLNLKLSCQNRLMLDLKQELGKL